MKCPFCQVEMQFHEGPTLDDYVCHDESCQFHKMARYSCTYHSGMLAVERIILVDDIYILVEWLLNKTTISKLDVVAISDHVVIHKALKFDLENLAKTIDKVRTWLIFS
jgi:hypothetical protein